ncbi:MAG: hypothetical protein ACP5C4_02215 [Methanomicrobiales archaeon]
MKKILIQVRKEDFEKIEPILAGRHTSIIHADDTVEPSSTPQSTGATSAT